MYIYCYIQYSNIYNILVNLEKNIKNKHLKNKVYFSADLCLRRFTLYCANRRQCR